MTLSSLQPLFTPVKMGDLLLPNRIVMAPLTRMRIDTGIRHLVPNGKERATPDHAGACAGACPLPHRFFVLSKPLLGTVCVRMRL